MTGEPLDQHYANWQAQPSQENLSKVVTALAPTISYALGSMNSTHDPVVQGHALVTTAEAVKNYQPTNEAGASLPTYVGHQLRGLTRLARQQRQPLPLPDRITLDAYQLHRVTKEFQDQHNREPDVLELADASGMPVKRIEKVRRHQLAVVPEEAAGDRQAELPNFDQEAVDYVYHDADHTDRRILELRTGYGGSLVMTPKDTALKLGLTPSQLTRRSARLSLKMQQLRGTIERVSM